MKKWLYIFCCLLAGSQANAAVPFFQQVFHVKVYEQSRELRYPWVGGLNSALFGKADMNNDGNKDLVVYDKTNNRFLVFKNPGLANSVAYELDTVSYNFPATEGWFILKDYNCDGLEDFFTYSGDGSIMVYTGAYVSGRLNFTLQQKGFYFKGTSGDINVYNVTIDKPALVDMNNDGDLDVVSFGVQGFRMVYYENQQKELLLPCDSLYFKIADNCWGNIYEDGASPVVTLRDTCSVKFPRLSGPVNVLHEGSTLEIADINGDGKKDALLADVSLNNLNYLKNEGSAAYASFLQQDTSFPSYNVPLRIHYFPAAYFLDIDNDGKTDLVASTFDAVGGATVESVWFYKNLSADSMQLQLQHKDFLLRDMIETGEGSHPCFFDYDNDGLKDLIIGTNGYKDQVNVPLYKLKLYRNTGTATVPAFTLANENFLNVDSLLLKEVSPVSGDIDNDGDIDIVAGLDNGRLAWWENTAGAGNIPVLAYKGFVRNDTGNIFSVGANSMPAIVDLNNDNINDLVIGERNGNLNFFRGTGINTQFRYVTDSLGKIKIIAPFTTLGFTAPSFADLDSNGKADLILGNYAAGLLWYKDVEDKLAGSFGVPDTLIKKHLGWRTAPVFADITSDANAELILGNLTGGLQFFTTDPALIAVRVIHQTTLDFHVFPNPANDRLYISLSGNNNTISVSLFNVVGQLEYFRKDIRDNQFSIALPELSGGIYFLEISDGEKRGVQKIIIQQ